MHVFEGAVAALPLPAGFDPAEVAELRWASRAELAAAVARQPDEFTPWFRIYLDRWSELALSAG